MIIHLWYLYIIMCVESLSWLSWDFSLGLCNTEEVYRARCKGTLYFFIEMKKKNIYTWIKRTYFQLKEPYILLTLRQFWTSFKSGKCVYRDSLWNIYQTLKDKFGISVCSFSVSAKLYYMQNLVMDLNTSLKTLRILSLLYSHIKEKWWNLF